MKKLTILAICILGSGCAPRKAATQCTIRCKAETIPPAVKKAADYAVFIYAKNQSGELIYSGSGFVVDRRGIIATARHILPKNRNYQLYVLIQEGQKTIVSRVLMWLNPTNTDAAILYIRHNFSGAIPLRFTPPQMNEKLFYAGYPYVRWHEIPYKIQKVIIHGYFHKFTLYKGKEFNDVVGLAHLPIMVGASGSPVLDTDGRALGIVSFYAQSGYTFTGFISTRHIKTLLNKQQFTNTKMPPL